MPSESQIERWKKILIHEISEYFFNFAFLTFFLVAFAWYRRLLLATYHIQYAGYWAPVVEAAILAKIIMIGNVLRVGRRLRGLQRWPLVVPTVYRTVAFSILVILFSVVEHALGALLHGRRASEGIEELTRTGWQGILAWWVLINVAFLPFFTVKEIETAFGADQVRGLFFRSPGRVPRPQGHGPGGPEAGPSEHSAHG